MPETSSNLSGIIIDTESGVHIHCPTCGCDTCHIAITASGPCAGWGNYGTHAVRFTCEWHNHDFALIFNSHKGTVSLEVERSNNP